MKTLILTHKADIDGLSPIIFLKLVRENVDTILLNANDINPKVTEIIKNKSYQKYDEIYITDLTLDKRTCELIMSTGYWDKFHSFDHHATNLISNDYPFGTAISKNKNGVNECATSLFYQYLLEKYPETFDTPALRDYTELVRQSDTWDWAKTNNLNANKLADLQSILGREEYIQTYVDYFKNNNEFAFTEKQSYLLDVEEKRIKRYLEESEKTMFHATLAGHPCGIVFAESHRSVLGNYLAEKYAYCIDYVILINMQQGLSFRAYKDDIHVGEIATIYGGGGHIKAAGAPLDNSIKREVIKLLLNNNDIFNK
jgi:oligoribonuclease NrnB/cAMP/cGMP phosphodiesterase (DHH superfamily)